MTTEADTDFFDMLLENKQLLKDIHSDKYKAAAINAKSKKQLHDE
jgi:hypothetical protein